MKDSCRYRHANSQRGCRRRASARVRELNEQHEETRRRAAMARARKWAHTAPRWKAVGSVINRSGYTRETRAIKLVGMRGRRLLRQSEVTRREMDGAREDRALISFILHFVLFPYEKVWSSYYFIYTFYQFCFFQLPQTNLVAGITTFCLYTLELLSILDSSKLQTTFLCLPLG